MNTFVKSGLAVLLCLIGSLTPLRSANAGAGVTVENTAANPVPVTGKVAITGTPSVSVSNFPTTQAVSVGNFPATQNVSATQPIPVHIVHGSAVQFSTGFQDQGGGFGFSGDAGYDTELLLNNSGKRFVIEMIHVSGRSTIPNPNFRINLSIDPETSGHNAGFVASSQFAFGALDLAHLELTLASEGVDSVGNYHFAITQPVHMVCDSKLYIDASRRVQTQFDGVDINFYGHYEDVN
jgi:hypothetical protein